MVTDLCLLLSIARGTHVQWLYREDMNTSRAQAGITHISHITRRFQGLEPLDHRARAREHTKRFLEGAYAALSEVALTYEVRSLIMAYIDGRSEDDFLEMRGVKLAVVAEMIKTQHGGSAASMAPGTSPAWRWLTHFLAPWRQPRRRRFGAALRAACRHAGFQPSRSTLQEFIASRNRLVHAGQFRSDPAAPVACSFSEPRAEYFFMLSFLDEFFLKLFRYAGPFVDWSRYPNHEQGMIR